MIFTPREGLINSRFTRPSVPGLVTRANSAGICWAGSLFMEDSRHLMAHCQPPDARSLRRRQEPPACDIQICQSARDPEPVGVLCQSAIADFSPSEDSLDH